MALSYKARKRWSIVVLLVGLPLYVVVAITLVGLMGRQHILIELPVYILLGVAWVFPLKAIFKGVGAEDPDNPVRYDDDHLKKW